MELSLCHCESLKRFPYVNVESLDLDGCSSLEKFPEILGIMKPKLEITISFSGIRELPLSTIHLQAHLTELDLSGMNNLVSLPSSICKLKGLVTLNVSDCAKLESLPEEIGDLENLEELNANYTLISRPPSSVVRLNKLKLLSFEKEESEDRVYFVFPQVNAGLFSLEELDLADCNLTDGGLPEDIGSLSSLKELDLSGNNFEHLPQSIAQLSTLQSLELSYCNKLKELPGFMGMPNLDTLQINCCYLIGLPEDIGSLSSLKELHLWGNNFQHLPQSIAQLGALRYLDLSYCNKLIQLPEFPQQLHTIDADWSNDSICSSLFKNISLFSASDSLSLRVFTSNWKKNIPSWFHHQENGTSISVKLPENWYVSDNFLGFGVCYSGELINAEAHLICYDERRPVTRITQKLALSNHSKYHIRPSIHFFLIPLAGLLDKSKANGKTPNDYGCIRLLSTGDKKKFGLRLLYKDEPVGIRRSRNEHHEEASCSSSKKQTSQVQVPVSSKTSQLFPTSLGF